MTTHTMFLTNQNLPAKLGPRFSKVEGDNWALIRWSFRYGPMIQESDADLDKLLAQIPAQLNAGDEDRLSVCEILEWVVDKEGDPTDYIPSKIRTLYEIDWYADPSEDEEG